MPPHTASIVLFFGFILCVPLVTFRLIYQNKPRGSTEDAGRLPSPLSHFLLLPTMMIYPDFAQNLQT
jgi:hypothetical protein